MGTNILRLEYLRNSASRESDAIGNRVSWTATQLGVAVGSTRQASDQRKKDRNGRDGGVRATTEFE